MNITKMHRSELAALPSLVKKQGNKTENEWFCKGEKSKFFFVVVNVFCCCVVTVVVLIQITEKGRCMIRVIKVLTARNGILFPKLFWSIVRKDCSSDQEKLLQIRGCRRRI